MATSKKGKKVINQDELRRLMREKQRQCTEKKKKVESPYAKYNSLGHLSCVLCNVQVKSELLWQTHVLGKQHKETVSELKSSSQQSLPQKRKTPDPDPGDGPGKKAKPTQGGSESAASADVFKKPHAPARKSAGLSLLAGVYEEDDSDEEDEEEGESSTEGKASGTTTNTDESESAPPAGLPDDFFDGSLPTVSHSGSIMKADESAEKRSAATPRKGNTAEGLPEGFFDDPVRDAKVRNVEAPQDLMDKEWDEFQKEIRQVNTRSDAIVAEDDEEVRLERQIEEIDEQIQCYRRVEVLRDRRDVVKVKPSAAEGHDEQEDANETNNEDEEEEEQQQEENEEELLDLLSRDWRAKGALA